jgi:NADH dehydrogenase
MRGAGGGMRVLVLGGAGFVGRHAVDALLRHGCEVVIGSRQPHRIGRRIPGLAERCAHRPARLERLTESRDWSALLEDVDVVLNCVGILRQRWRETYRRVHHLAPAALAQACRERNQRLIHVSALGLRPDARSRFLRSKLDGENAVRASGADWFIVRPSLLDGDGGYGAKWLRRIARWPVHALPADATGRIAALHVADLGEALASIALADAQAMDDDARIVELGGLRSWTLAEYVAAIRSRTTDRPALRWPIPGPLARLGSHLCDLLHVTPFSFGHWELLRRDNCPYANRLQELLGRPPRAMHGPVTGIDESGTRVPGPCALPAEVRMRELVEEQADHA